MSLVQLHPGNCPWMITAGHRFPDGRHWNSTTWGRGCKQCALEDQLRTVFTEWTATPPGQQWITRHNDRARRLWRRRWPGGRNNRLIDRWDGMPT